MLLHGLAVLATEGRAAAASELSRAARMFADGEIPAAEGLRWAWLARIPAIMLWDEERWHQILVRQVQSVREAGLLVHLPIYLQSLAIFTIWGGDFSTAASLVAEADAIAEATGTLYARVAVAFLAGLRGKEAEACALIEIESSNA